MLKITFFTHNPLGLSQQLLTSDSFSSAHLSSMNFLPLTVKQNNAGCMNAVFKFLFVSFVCLLQTCLLVVLWFTVGSEYWKCQV